MGTIKTQLTDGSAADLPHGVTVSPLTPIIGAEVSGLFLGDALNDETIRQVRSALLKHKVLVFRDQDITAEQHVAFAKRFGELEIHPIYEHHPEFDELVVLRASKDKPAAENIYHADTTFREKPGMGSILRCVECPDVGGDTIWCNMVEAYSRLPEHVKRVIDGTTAVHDVMPSFSKIVSDPEKRKDIRKQLPPVEHPVVRTHPESGEKILYVNQTFTSHFAGYNAEFEGTVGRERKLDSDNMLLYLTRQAEIPEYQVRIRWAPNTIVFWDNRSTQHYAIQDYFPASRCMHRATIIGDVPF